MRAEIMGTRRLVVVAPEGEYRPSTVAMENYSTYARIQGARTAAPDAPDAEEAGKLIPAS